MGCWGILKTVGNIDSKAVGNVMESIERGYQTKHGALFGHQDGLIVMVIIH